MIAALARRLRSDARGFALTEFAFTAPVLIFMYLGSYQLCSAISAQRKVSTTARAITDLTTQYQQVSNADLDSVLSAATQVLAPYDIANATLIVSQIKIDNSGKATVDWSQAKNTTPLVQGSLYNVPASIKQNGTSLIVGQVTYQYTSGVASPILGDILLHDMTYMAPRTVSTIKNTG